MKSESQPVLVRAPEEYIIRLRGQSVMLDTHLAEIYGVTVKRLNEQIKRNILRFPKDFVFKLTSHEWKNLKSQFAASSGHGGRRSLPHAFTEHGAIMAATVLNSPQAVQMSVGVVRAFVKLRRMALSVETLARKVTALEKQYDAQFGAVFDAIRQLMTPPNPPHRKIGFNAD